MLLCQRKKDIEMPAGVLNSLVTMFTKIGFYNTYGFWMMCPTHSVLCP